MSHALRLPAWIRSRPILPATIVVCSLAIFGGCASPLAVTSDPPGATAIIGGKNIGVTPTQIQLPDQKPTRVEFRKDGYFPESFVFQPGEKQKEISATLALMSVTRKLDFTSNPPGATVTIDGRVVGRTPLAGHDVVFTRESKSALWRTPLAVVSLPDHQSESLQLHERMPAVPRFELSLLREERVYRVLATTTSGEVLNADVTVNGSKLGQPTPTSVPITFERPDKTALWPKFEVSIEVPAQYKRVALTWDYPSSTSVAVKLEPVVEITTTLISPALAMTPTGVAFRIHENKANAMLNTRESAAGVGDLKPVTDFPRQDIKEISGHRRDSINSFCISPDGQNVIYSLTEHEQQGAYFSNLYIKRADDSAGGISRLTEGSRFLDTLPHIANDGSNYLVFASNRGERHKPDIFRATLSGNRLAGGVSRLTSDSRHNFSPSYGDSNRQLFYLSTESNFPVAEPVLCSIRIDGSLPTQLPISATEINNTFAERIFYVRADAETRKKQIFSATADGRLETALLNRDEFRRNHCFHPAVSPDGSRVLFVSDQATDELGRSNHDIYMINSDGTGLRRLTQNGSDDIMPVWSPAEEGVVFFLSNRGGSYNVWRMKLVAGAK